MRFELTTPTLARLCSTPELRPLIGPLVWPWRSRGTLLRKVPGNAIESTLEIHHRKPVLPFVIRCPMPATRHDLFAHFQELGIVTTTVEHAPLFTVEESQALRGELPGGHCKSLFLKSKKGRLYLVVTLEEAPVHLKDLSKVLGGGRLSFGKPDLLYDRLGVTPGSVTPFAVINDPEAEVQMVLDQAMLECDLLNYHPLDNRATTAIKTPDLLRFIEACGHQPQIIDLAAVGDFEA